MKVPRTMSPLSMTLSRESQRVSFQVELLVLPEPMFVTAQLTSIVPPEVASPGVTREETSRSGPAAGAATTTIDKGEEMLLPSKFGTQFGQSAWRKEHVTFDRQTQLSPIL